MERRLERNILPLHHEFCLIRLINLIGEYVPCLVIQTFEVWEQLEASLAELGRIIDSIMQKCLFESCSKSCKCLRIIFCMSSYSSHPFQTSFVLPVSDWTFVDLQAVNCKYPDELCRTLAFHQKYIKIRSALVVSIRLLTTWSGRVKTGTISMQLCSLNRRKPWEETDCIFYALLGILLCENIARIVCLS